MPPKKATKTAPPKMTPADELKTLQASATHHYAIKDYAEAANLYSQAVELQATINGEMAPENADLLYAYGRALYHLAISRSDVLGGQVAGEKQKPKSKKKKPTKEAGPSESSLDKTTDASLAAESKSDQKKEPGKPYFQIEGDDDEWDTDEEDGDEGADDGEDVDGADDDQAAEEADDDFAIAYEILDSTRVLLEGRVESLTGIDPSLVTSAPKDKPSQPFSEAQLAAEDTRTLLERLADVYDLQSEISLENENFPLAIEDGRSSLALKSLLFPPSSKFIGEIHLKLALALEMAAKTTTKGADDDQLGREEGEAAGFDEEIMKEAVVEMETAIEGTSIRLAAEKESVGTLDGEAKAEKEKEIKDVAELLTDMKARLDELRAPPVSLNAAVSGVSGAGGEDDPMAAIKGILGGLLGQAPADRKKIIDEAKATANDLTSMVRSSKRRADDGAANGSGKKAKVEEDGGQDELQ